MHGKETGSAAKESFLSNIPSPAGIVESLSQTFLGNQESRADTLAKKRAANQVRSPISQQLSDMEKPGLVLTDPKPSLTPAADQQAQHLFDQLNPSNDLSEESMRLMAEEAAKLALSRERHEVVLKYSADARLTCAQLRQMLELCSLDAHKKEVIFSRYAQLKDKDNFREEVVNQFTRSTALRAVLMAELNKNLLSRSS